MQKNLSILVGDVITCPLEQDYVEGVEDHEWVCFLLCFLSNIFNKNIVIFIHTIVITSR
jgi:hypothetical protein